MTQPDPREEGYRVDDGPPPAPGPDLSGEQLYGALEAMTEMTQPVGQIPTTGTQPAPLFEGHARRECGEHRTVGAHRAWCHSCGEWCYPGDDGCKGCRLGYIGAPLAQELAPSGWIIAAPDDSRFESVWVGDIYRNSADAVTELEAARAETPLRELQLYALYPCADPVEDR